MNADQIYDNLSERAKRFVSREAIAEVLAAMQEFESAAQPDESAAFDAMKHQVLLGYDESGDAIFGTDPVARARATAPQATMKGDEREGALYDPVIGGVANSADAARSAVPQAGAAPQANHAEINEIFERQQAGFARCFEALGIGDDDDRERGWSSLVLAINDARAAALQATVKGDERGRVRDAIADAIGGDAYECTRVWSAWGVGTMSEDDFTPIVNDESRLYEIADAAIRAVAPQAGAPNDAAITACALMIKGICMTLPQDQWSRKIEDRIRFMLAASWR